MEIESIHPQIRLTSDIHVNILDIYKNFLKIEGLSASEVLESAISELMTARSMGNDRSLYGIRTQKESAIKRIQEALINATSFITAMGLDEKYGQWLVLKEEEGIIRKKAREDYIKVMQQDAAKEMGCRMEEA